MDFNERTRKVEYLLRIKFPTSWAPPPINSLRASGGYGGSVFSPTDHERHKRLMEAIETERMALLRQPAGELDALYIDAVRASKAQEDAKAQLQEKARFFHQGDAAADFDYWAKAEYWSLDETVALLLGKAPEVVTWKAVQPFVNISGFAKQYERLRNLALRAQAMNRGQAAVYPAAVLAWAAELDVPVPSALTAAIAERLAKREAAQATTRQPDAPSSESPAPDDESDPDEEFERQLVAEADLRREKLVAERAEIDATAALTFEDRRLKRQELERIDAELHDIEGGLPSTHPNWAAMQLARISARPMEYIATVHVDAGAKLFRLSEVPTLTARAAFTPAEGSSGVSAHVDYLMVEGLHRDKLMAAVRGGVVTPYMGESLEPVPRHWDPRPNAGYVLPIGELRTFAHLLLMDVKVKASDAPGATRVAELPADAVADAVSVVHTLATRRDVLDPLIDLAEKTATNADDRAAVWNALTALAMAKDKPHPLRGFADRSVQYLDGDDPKFLTRDAFNKRWDRRKGKAAANRR